MRHCSGPIRTEPGAILDPTDPTGKKWLDNPRFQRIVFCQHGLQYAHWYFECQYSGEHQLLGELCTLCGQWIRQEKK